MKRTRTVSNDILRTLIGKVVPYVNPIRDYKGNVVEENPSVLIKEVWLIQGFKFFEATFYGGVKCGESCYLTLDQIIAF